MKKIYFILLVFMSLFFVGCQAPTNASFDVKNKTITLYIGDEPVFLNEFIINGTKEGTEHYTHTVPIDSEGKITEAGEYSVTYEMMINGVQCTADAKVVVFYKPVISILNNSITLEVGDQLSPLDYVNAKGTRNEDITSSLEVVHSIPLSNKLVTTAGKYTIDYQITIFDVKYQNTLEVIINEGKSETASFENGDFENNLSTPFTKSDFEGSDSVLSVLTENDNHLLQLDIKAVSWGSAAPRIEYSGLYLNPNKIYEISFDAYSDEARTLRLQLGQLLNSDPWFKAAFSEVRYFDLTTEKTNYKWTVQPDTSISGADLTNLSLLLEFGKYENWTSINTLVYLDNFELNVVETMENDEIAPKLIPIETREYYFLSDRLPDIEKIITYRDERNEQLTITVDTAHSLLPPVDSTNHFTTAGNYRFVYNVVDKAGNKAGYTWSFEVKNSYPTTNGFNLIDFKDNSAGHIEEGITQYGYVYAENDDTTFTYENGVLTIITTQSQENNNWTATQVFARSVRQTGFDGANKYTVSFDIESNVEGYIQFNETPFKLNIGLNHIAIEKYIFVYNYVDFTLVLGVHKSLMPIEQNIGPCTVKISNFSFVSTQNKVEDDIPPVIRLTEKKTFFVGDKIDLFSTVQITDFRGQNGVTIEIDPLNSDIIPMIDGKVTEAGIYHITFIGSDPSGNKSSYDFDYTVREKLVNSNGFSIETIQFGEEGTIDDPSVIYYWQDSGCSIVREVIDRNNFKLKVIQPKSGIWYSSQLFFKSLPVDKWTLYELSFDIISDVAGNITVMNEGMTIPAGTTKINKQIAIKEGDFQKITMQFGRNGYNTMGVCNIEIRNLSLVEVEIPEENIWEGYQMDVDNQEDQSVITYNNIPSAWSSVNARTYNFNTNDTFEAIVVEFIGTENHKYQFKFEGITEATYIASSVVATGEVQKVILDARNCTENQRLTMFNLLMFVESIGASGTATILNYSFYDDFKSLFDTEWYSFSGMEIFDTADGSTISYSGIPSEWWNMNAQYDMDNQFLSSSTKVIFTFTGTANQTYLFKIEGWGYVEKPVVATGVEQIVEVDISSIGSSYIPLLHRAVVFCKTVNATGSITINSVVVSD